MIFSCLLLLADVLYIMNGGLMDRDEMVRELLEEHPIDEMVKFSDLDIMEKLKENPFQIVRYKEMYYKELSIYNDLEDKYELLMGKQYDYYRFDFDKELTKPEIEKYYLPKDKKVMQMKKILRRQDARVKFFEMAFKGFEQAGWRMSKFIDAMRGGM